MQAIMETLFDIAYLCTVITLGIIMIKRAKGSKQFMLFGIMAVVLGCGDAFHLVPRAYALLTTGLENHAAALGFGKLVTSVTMTVFYVILYHIYRIRYNVSGEKNISALVYALAILRVALCAFVQNDWLSATPSLAWGIYRNIPFAILGALIIWLYYKRTKETKDKAFKNMPLAIIISFAMYIPVVLFAEAFPLVGILMIPKTVAYAWIVFMGFSDLKAQSKRTLA